MNKSQQEIHKIDMSGESVNPEGQLDILLSDLLEQITLIAEANELEKNTRISMMREYIRGFRDGFRTMKKNPFFAKTDSSRT